MTGRSSQARLAKPANVGATSRSNSAVSDMEGSRRSSVAVPTVMALTNGSCIVGVFGNSNEKVHIYRVLAKCFILASCIGSGKGLF